MGISRNTSRASSPLFLPTQAQVSSQIRTSSTTINSRTQLEKDIDEFLHGVEIPKQIPIQSRASSQTNNSDAEHQLNLKKAAAFGAGFANRKPHASQEELEQGFQSFMAKISKVATHIETQPKVVSKPTPKKSNSETLHYKLEHYDPDNSSVDQMYKVRNNINYRFKTREKKKIDPVTALQQEFTLKELQTMQKFMEKQRETNFNLDYLQKEIARIQSVEQAIKTYPDNPKNTIEEDSKPAAKKRKT